MLNEKLTWTSLKKADDLVHQVEGIENLERHRFDAIRKEVKDGDLIVTGEKQITERVEGLGGAFTYFTLGDPLDLDAMLTGKQLPDYATLGGWLFHTATGETLDPEGIDPKRQYLGASTGYHAWLLYRPEREWLRSREAALTLSHAEEISRAKKDKPHLVFAPACYVPATKLRPMHIEFAPLPFALYRVEKD